MKRTGLSLLAGTSLAGALAFAGPASADNDLTWSYATAQVATCLVGVTCGSPSGATVLGRETFTGSNVDYNNASVYRDDYSSQTPYDYGHAWASAQAGEGDLALPVLKAYALGGISGGPGGGGGPLTVSIDTASVQGVQGYTNKGTTALLIPLNAFTGLVDYKLFGPANNGGVLVGAGLAITTSAILDPSISTQWWQPDPTPGHFGQFAANCDTPGALAIGNPSPQAGGVSGGSLNYLQVTTSSCTGSNTFQLDPGESFYIWARLSVLRSGPGATDVSQTFNVTITPEIQDEVAQNLVNNLRFADSGLEVRTDAAVPEPSSWALMILGFGAAGSLLRRQRRVAI